MPPGNEESPQSQQASDQVEQPPQVLIPPRDEEAEAAPLEGMPTDSYPPSVSLMCTYFIDLLKPGPSRKKDMEYIKMHEIIESLDSIM